MTGVAEVSRSPHEDPSSDAAVDEASSPLGIGVVIWLASEVMFFAGLFAAYFALLAENSESWPPSDVDLDVVRMGFFTTVLIVSSITMHLSVQAAEKRRRGQALGFLIATIALGAAFLVNVGFEYAGFDFTWQTHAYGTIFFLLTGFHGLHVAGGLVLLSLVAWVVFSRHSKLPSTHTLRVSSYYWHFVDVVWIAVFVVVYLIQ